MEVREGARLKKTRYPKLRNLVLFSVWEDTRVWAHGSHSFDMTSAILGQYPVFSHPESPQGSPLGVAAV